MFPRYNEFPINEKIFKNDYFLYESETIHILHNDIDDIIYYTEIFFALVYTEDIIIKIQGTGIV